MLKRVQHDRLFGLLYRRTKEYIYEFLIINRLEDGNFK